MAKKWSPTAKTRNMKQDMKVMKTSHDNVKLGNKNVNVEETNYFTAQKYLITKGKLAFYWLIVLVRMTTPISSHVTDKNVTLSARGDNFFFLKENPRISSVSTGI